MSGIIICEYFQDNGISNHGWMWNYLKSFTFVVCMFSYSNWLLLLSFDLILIVTILLLFSFFTKVVFSFFLKNEIISLQPIPVVVKQNHALQGLSKLFFKMGDVSHNDNKFKTRTFFMFYERS